MTVRPLISTDIDGVVELHCRVLDWSINGRLGADHIRTMYSALLAGDDIVAYISESGQRLLGFMVATADYKRARTRFRRAIGVPGLLRILRGLLLKPADWLDFAETVTVVPYTMGRSGYKAELLSWVTDQTDPMGRRAAFQCMDAVLRALSERGHTKCLAQVLKCNSSPNKFHERMGSKTLSTFIRNKIYLVDCGVKRGV
jgi:hypothetical protein